MGKNVSLVNNYRAIGLSSVNCKVWEVSWRNEQLKVLKDNRKKKKPA